MTLLSMSSHSSVDRAPARCSGGHGSIPVGAAEFSLSHARVIVIFHISHLIIYMKKLLDSDWLRAVQFKCNTSAKSVTPVQKV